MMTRIAYPLPFGAAAIALLAALAFAPSIAAQQTRPAQQSDTPQRQAPRPDPGHRFRQHMRDQRMRDRLQQNSLREQQRQQNTEVTRKAFSGTDAERGILQADKARNDQYRSLQKHDLDDYLNAPQQPQTPRPAQSTPAPARSAGG